MSPIMWIEVLHGAAGSARIAGCADLRLNHNAV